MIKPWKILEIRETEAGRFVDYECHHTTSTDAGGVSRRTLRSGFLLDEGEDPEEAVKQVLIDSGWIDA